MVASPTRRLDFSFSIDCAPTSVRPSGEYATEKKCMPREFFSFNNSFLVSRSVTLTELSPALARRIPSGENATEGMKSSCLENTTAFLAGGSAGRGADVRDSCDFALPFCAKARSAIGAFIWPAPAKTANTALPINRTDRKLPNFIYRLLSGWKTQMRSNFYAVEGVDHCFDHRDLLD